MIDRKQEKDLDRQSNRRAKKKKRRSPARKWEKISDQEKGLTGVRREKKKMGGQPPKRKGQTLRIKGKGQRSATRKKGTS